MADTQALAVTGATGHIGGRVARHLAAAGVAHRLIVRDPGRAPKIPGTDVAAASYADGPAMRTALDGVHTLFMVSASEAPDRLAQHRTAVDAAAEAGVQRLVYVSFLNAAQDSTFTLARDHWATEQHIRDRIPRWTFLRDSLYADFVPDMVGPDGIIRGPAGDGKASVVARDDVAESAAAILRGDTGEHDGIVYDITGPEALSFPEIADELAAATTSQIAYLNESVEEAYASRAKYNAPDWQLDAWVSTYTAIAAGELATVSDAVERLTGRPATRLADLLAKLG